MIYLTNKLRKLDNPFGALTSRSTINYHRACWCNGPFLLKFYAPVTSQT